MNIDPAIIKDLLTFYCPFTPEVHPDRALLTARTLAWVEHYDLCNGDAKENKIMALKGSDMVAHFYPRVDRGAQALYDYTAWAFVVNKEFVPYPPEGRTRGVVERTQRWVDIMHWSAGVEQADGPLELSLHDCMSRLRAAEDPVRFHRFMEPQTRWLWGQLRETAYRERHAKLTLNQYLAMRYWTAGVDAAEGYLHLLPGDHLTEEQCRDPRVRAAVDAIIQAGALCNDKYSYLVEASAPDRKKYNLIDVLREEDPKLSLRDGIKAANAIIDRFITIYLHLKKQILPTASTCLIRYLEDAERVFAGNLLFGSTSIGYAIPGAERLLTFVDSPSDSSLEPPPYPSLSRIWGAAYAYGVCV